MALVGAMAAAMAANQVTSNSARNSARQAAQNQNRNQGRRPVVGSYINGDGKNMSLLDIERNAVLDLWSEHIIEMQAFARSKGWELVKLKHRYLYVQLHGERKDAPQREQFKQPDSDQTDYKAYEAAYVAWRNTEFKKFVQEILPTYERYDTLIKPHVEMFSLEQ